jgi:peptide/nickel transport system substrate-binding protein
MRKLVLSLAATAMACCPLQAYAQEGEIVPEVHFLTWPADKYQQFSEATNYMAEQWRELGLRVNVDPQAFPNPMLAMWFNEHKFDVVLSSMSAAPHRFEPDFFTNSQFNSANTQPGNWNVGEYSNPEVDRLSQEQLGIYDETKRREVILKIQEVLNDDPPEIVINYISQAFPINTDNVEIVDFSPSPEGVRANENVIRMQSKTGNAVRIGWTVSYSTLNPFVANTLADAELMALIYDRLLWIGGDGKPDMMLAKEIKVIDDKTVEVTLRDDSKFSDGKPVTAQDVKFSFDYLKEWKAVSLQSYLKDLETTEIVDDHTVRFNLLRPYAPFIMNTLGQVYVLPKHVWETLVEKEGVAHPKDFANREPVGSGPYSVKHWKEGQELYLQRKPDHFSKPLSDILHIAFGSAEVLGQSIKKGDIDVSFQPIVPTAMADFVDQPNIKIYEGYSNGNISARFKVTGPVFWNRDLRKALLYATPYDQINADIYDGMARKSASAITPMNPFWHNDKLEEPRLDMEKARKILTDAGFSWDSEGQLHFPPK